MEIETRAEAWMEWIIRAVAIGVASLAVSYLRDIGKETAMLSMQFLELKYEIKRLADANLNYAEKLENIEKRIKALEEKK
jgi:phosphoribosylaminoimidazole-succinocarboxamide synthase